MKKNIFLVCFLLILIALSNYPLYQFWKASSSYPDTTFLFQHGDWAHDYFAYLSYINFGENGQLTRPYRYDINFKQKTFLHIFYMLGGYITAPLNLKNYQIYHLLRFLCILAYIYSAILLIKITLGKNDWFPGILLAFTATISPHLLLNVKFNPGAYPNFLPWWLDYDSLSRLYALPHHLAGTVLLTLSVLTLIFWNRTTKVLYAILSSLSILLVGIVFPYALFPIILIFLTYTLIQMIILFRKRHLKYFLHVKSPILFILIMSLVASLAVAFYSEKTYYPDVNYRLWEVGLWNNKIDLNKDAIWIYGILPILALPAIFFKKNTNKTENLLLASWGFYPFIMLPFANLVGIPKIRLFQVNSQIPLAILTLLTLRKLPTKKSGRLIKTLILIVLISSSLIISIYILVNKSNTIDKFLSSNVNKWHIFIPNDIIKASKYLALNGNKNETILSTTPTGNILSALTLSPLYLGHFQDIPNRTTREKFAADFFFNRNVNKEDIEKIFEKYKIRWIFWGPYEAGYNINKPSYPFLKPVYHSGQTIIYESDLK